MHHCYQTEDFAHTKADTGAVGLEVENTKGQVDRVDPDGDASEGHDDAGQEEDEDEQHRASPHRDPVLDGQGRDVGELWN